MTVTRRDVLNRIEECEKNGEFDKHVDPINYDDCLPVTESFPYVPKNILYKTKIFFEHNFIVKPFMKRANRDMLHTSFYGLENLDGIDSAVVICNHVDKFECMAVKQALNSKGHKLKIVGAEFNNQKHFLGEMMRAGGMLPLSSNHKVMRRFNEAIDYYLSHKTSILFYPEQAMWWHYEKPRPFKNGAFHYAVKHNVPIVPIFITFTLNGTKDEEGIDNKDFHLHVMKPIYPQKELTNRENVEYLKNTSYEMCKKKYEKFYKKPLVFNTKDN